MKYKTMLMGLVTLLLLALVVSSVAAQGRDPRPRFDDDRDFCEQWGRRGGDVERCEELMQRRDEMLQNRAEGMQNRGERLSRRGEMLQNHGEMLQRWLEDGRLGDGVMAGGWWAELAEQYGLDLLEVRERLAAGETVQDILAEAGVDMDAAIDALLAQAEERHALAVESGRLTQEQADAMLQTLRERLQSGAVWCSPRRCA